MWKEQARIAVASAFWVTAVMTMVMATIDSDWLVLAGWGVLSALGGSILIFWHLLVQERTRVSTIAKLLTTRDDPESAEGIRRV